MNFRAKDNLRVTFSDLPQQINHFVEAMLFYLEIQKRHSIWPYPWLRELNLEPKPAENHLQKEIVF
ncbi:hypothetical protein I79_020834 [Cricetulus griseus]|uniref:Uncharacterized protein n=1 Tax=Cricetulus griseus TaxID=10029 RepID=G3IB45_CRIGR|nr:hypothetical protein I79_020834 [Cricetulus griseus]